MSKYFCDTTSTTRSANMCFAGVLNDEPCVCMNDRSGFNTFGTNRECCVGGGLLVMRNVARMPRSGCSASLHDVETCALTASASSGNVSATAFSPPRNAESSAVSTDAGSVPPTCTRSNDAISAGMRDFICSMSEYARVATLTNLFGSIALAHALDDDTAPLLFAPLLLALAPANVVPALLAIFFLEPVVVASLAVSFSTPARTHEAYRASSCNDNRRNLCASGPRNTSSSQHLRIASTSARVALNSYTSLLNNR
mmetsp:Transcript_16/g.36  ORF Transcript_16/g.36 Transcript_16/m.36 type:complete len:255 (-) Transcript_16:978-1742(-)